MARVISIGECMIELAPNVGGSFALGYAGDTFNSAVYMARLGLDVSYATALGDDPHSDAAVAFMAGEDIDTSLVVRVPSRVPGLYLINNDHAGERTFTYWRDTAPIRDLLTEGSISWRTALSEFDCIYLSGITMAVVGAAGRDVLAGGLAEARRRGVAVMLDLNYRAALWTDTASARGAFDTIVPLCTIVSTSAEDLTAIWPETDDSAACLARDGIEVINRRASLDATVHLPCGTRVTRSGSPVSVSDATGAGDSFNAGYLATRLGGADAGASLVAGHRLAGAVVQSRGAILPRDRMPNMTEMRKTA